MSTAKIIELNEENICKMCRNQLGKYSCPRCNVLYCSIVCYRSEQHLECSETFYKECYMSELTSQNRDQETRTRMTEILSRFQEQSDMDMNESLDSDDDQQLPDLAERLGNVDLSDADKVWSLLGDDERQEFEALLQSGDVAKMVPIWMAWWENKIKREMVQPLDTSDKQNCYNYKEICPALLSDVKPFNELCKTKPAECVKYNLLNILASYVCVVRYFNGDHFQFSKEAVYLLTNLSLNFNSNKNYDSFTSAIDSVHYMCLSNDWISVDADHKIRMYNDVRNMAEGPEESNKTYYMKAALSDMHRLMTVSKKATATPSVVKSDNEFSKRFLDNELPENKTVSREILKSYIKKVEYYLSFITSYENVFP